MKRDMNLIRLLLLDVEGDEPKPDLSNYTDEQKGYHLAKLVEAGLVNGEISRDNNGSAIGAFAVELTWQGHEFLEAARSEKVWNRALSKAKSEGVEVSISILKELLTQTAKGFLGMP
jgi:hypothetical protein